MTVNPKKLRPYDEPPKRRRTLIPGAPDSAATGFLVAAALWLGVATALGALAIGLRFVNVEVSFPFGIFGLSFEFDQRRVDYAFVNASVYGWLTNAGLGAVAFMTPRLIGRPLAMERGLNVALAIWNLSLAGGIAALYVFDLGPNAPLTAVPWLFEGGLALAALIVTGAFFASVGVELRTAYVSLWFAAVALLGLLGLTGLNALLGLVEVFINLPELAIALTSVYVERALSVMWLLGMAYATLHYVVPRGTGQPLASAGVAMLAFLAWLVLSPLAGLNTLLDSSVPYAVTSLGAVATILLLVPAALTVINLAQTIQGRWSLVFGTGTAAFAVVSLAFLFGASLLEAIGALRPVAEHVGGTDWARGAFVWAAYGTFTFAAFAVAEHALPRLLHRVWSGGFLSGAQLWLAFGGATLAGLALMGSGLAEGSLRAQGSAPDAIAAGVVIYRAVALAGMGMVALAGLAFMTNMFLLYTAGRPVEYIVPAQSVAAPAGQ
jgi:cytochrome c oxidase cbb3-type subunit 1